jgi:hypothetical protein
VYLYALMQHITGFGVVQAGVQCRPISVAAGMS